MRPTTGGSPARRRAASASGRPGDRDDRAGELEQRQRAAADLADDGEDLLRPRRCPRRAGARGRPSAASSAVSIASTGSSARARPGRGRARASPRARRARACRAAARGPAGGRGGGDRVRAADEHARLRTAEQLVAREADERGAGRHRAAHGRLLGERREVVGEGARADVVDHRRPELAQLLDRDLLTNPSWRKFDGWARRIAPGRRPDRARVVGPARAVRRADLDEPGAGLRDDVGDPEPAADLDQLPARDDDLAPRPGERRGREKHRGGAVVDRHAASAPDSSVRRAATWSCREPRAPVSTSHSRFESPARATAACAVTASARGRSAWTITPSR